MKLPKRKMNRFESSINVYESLGKSLVKKTSESPDLTNKKINGFMNSNFTL